MNTNDNHDENNRINGTNGTLRHSEEIDSFRAWLQTVIVAHQFGQTGCLSALPGGRITNHCRTLADIPGNVLAAELAAPVWAVLDQINTATTKFARALRHENCPDEDRPDFEQVLWQLDFTLALVLRRLTHLVKTRAKQTQCSDLLCELLVDLTENGPHTVHLLRRYHELCPDEFNPSENEYPSPAGAGEGGRRPDEGAMASRFSPADVGPVPSPGVTPLIQESTNPEIQPSESLDLDLFGDFAWDTYLRVEALDRLADEFPANVRAAARHMHGWPMLAYRHHGSQKRIQELADRLQLGVDYPLDASASARCRPDTPMTRFLDAWVCQIEYIRGHAANASHASPEKEQAALRLWWRETQNERPNDDVAAILPVVPTLPPLTKSTASEWAEKAIVPLIMVTDARDWQNCADPALQRIAGQSGVKSQATFKSRLQSAITSSLRRLARPD